MAEMTPEELGERLEDARAEEREACAQAAERARPGWHDEGCGCGECVASFKAAAAIKRRWQDLVAEELPVRVLLDRSDQGLPPLDITDDCVAPDHVAGSPAQPPET